MALGCALAALALGCGDSGDETPAAGTQAAQPAAPDASKKATRAEKLAAQPAEITKGELPKFYPSDLPLFPDSKPTTSMMVGGAGLIVLTTSAPVADVLAHYREQLPAQGWTLDKVSEKPPRIAAHKEGRKATVSLSRSGETTEIGVALSGS
jgi:hypothetical protein